MTEISLQTQNTDGDDNLISFQTGVVLSTFGNPLILEMETCSGRIIVQKISGHRRNSIANPERTREEMIMMIDIPGKQEASPVCVCDSESYCAEAVKAEEKVIAAKTAIAVY
ncbi:unnamed protein product [Microthlaspi erraticum]|uniref:Uncharacterized protein n=1 Tax=Microthlaspi erraticum TaxID=1685480 RepID=A0A6D2L4H0_9BRAS|nr:unnamed protein product [Microthlaspi erraticum]CAA7059674.1 unnamed protein product [Microthlaspi erraticum]